jgi:phosphatidylglycerophosphate synthase
MPTIAETYRLTRKLPDLPWNQYVCRPVAAVLVHAAAETRVTPNQITLASLVVGLASAALFVVLPGHSGLAVAALVFEVSYVLDCADGMLARLRRKQSTAGHLFDFLMDEIKAFTILAACATRLFRDHADDRYLLVGMFGLVALATGVALTTFVRRPEIDTTRSAASTAAAGGKPSPLRRVLGAAESVAKFVSHYPSYIWLVAFAGRLEWYLFPYVTVHALYAARTLAGVAMRFGRGGA